MSRYCTFWRMVMLVALWIAAPALGRAEIHGGIEIGAKGIRAIAVDVPAGTGDSKVLMVENENTTLVADLAATKQYSPKALQKTAAIVGRLTEKLRGDFKVPDHRLYIVGSSGLFAPIEGNPDLIMKNKEVLVRTIKETSGLSMDFISVKREAELTITSVVPKKDRYAAVLIDIGSGNTKGGGEKEGMGLITFGIPFGTVTFTDRVKKEAAKGRFHETAPSLQKSLRGKTELAERKRVYLAGGAVWALTTFMKPDDRGSFVTLSPQDFDSFYKFLLDHPVDLPDPHIGENSSADSRKLALKDIAQVRRIFSRDQLLSGVEVLKAIADAFRLDGQDKQIYFARNAYIGWILGYTIAKGSSGI
jgi:exopolyphosphatase/pppGpp-phosphohydrolase